MEVQQLLEDLRARYPQKEWYVDPTSGKIGFVHEGMFITDPWLTDCGRFEVDPRLEYGLTIVSAIKIKAHNLPIENAEYAELMRTPA